MKSQVDNGDLQMKSLLATLEHKLRSPADNAIERVWQGLATSEWKSSLRKELPMILREPWAALSCNQQVLYYLRREWPRRWGRRELATIVQEATIRGFLTWRQIGEASQRGFNSINDALREGDDRLLELLLPTFEEVASEVGLGTLPPPLQQTLNYYTQEVHPASCYKTLRGWRQGRVSRFREGVFMAYGEGLKRPPLYRRLPVLEAFGADLGQGRAQYHYNLCDGLSQSHQEPK